MQRFKENRFSIDSEIQVLTSYATAERAARKLSLEWQFAKLDPKLDIHIRTLKTPGEQTELSLKIMGPDRYVLRDTTGAELLHGISGEFSTENGYSANFVIHKARKGDSAVLTKVS